MTVRPPSRSPTGTSGAPRPRRAWAVPAGVAAAVALGITAAAVAPSVATATSPAPARRGPGQLLAAIRASGVRPLSGTIRQSSELGLPALPGVTDSATSPTALLSGSHTAQVWIRSATEERIAVLGSLSETDVIRDGPDLWVWDSSANTVQHLVSTPGARGPGPGTGPAPLSPAQLATRLVTALRPTTTLTVGPSVRVAGRSAYELGLAPRQQGSLIGRIAIDVDAATGVPLRVEIFTPGSTDAAFTTAFTSIHFAVPSEADVAFTPPVGATVTTRTLAPAPDGPGTRSGRADRVLGSGWTRVVVTSGVGALVGVLGAADATEPARVAAAEWDPAPGSGHPSVAASGSRSESGGAGQLQVLLDSATRVTGAFGHGRLLRTSLVCVLVLDDGRVLAGAVTPEVLESDARS